MTNLEQENKEIGLRIRTARKAKRLNQTEFAELLNKSLRTVQKYESGEIEVSVAVVKEIAKVLECSPSYLLGWDEEKKVFAGFFKKHLAVFFLQPICLETAAAVRPVHGIAQRFILTVTHQRRMCRRVNGYRQNISAVYAAFFQQHTGIFT